jgi:hypothetical protein
MLCVIAVRYYDIYHNNTQRNEIRHNDTHPKVLIMLSRYAECHYSECCIPFIVMLCCYAECHYSDCCIPFIVMLCVVMLSVVMLSVVMLSVVMLSVVMLSVVILSVMAPGNFLSKSRGRSSCKRTLRADLHANPISQ